jgi:hypothetical protein
LGLLLAILASSAGLIADSWGSNEEATWIADGEVTMTTTGFFTSIVIQSPRDGVLAFRAQHEQAPTAALNLSGPGRITFSKGVIAVAPTAATAPTWMFAVGGKQPPSFRAPSGDVRKIAVVGLARFADPAGAAVPAGPSEPACTSECGPGASACSVGCGTSCSVTCQAGYNACCYCPTSGGSAVCTCCK